MQKVEQLKQEIEDFEREIQKLQQQLAAAGGRTLQLAIGDSPSDISKALQLEAQQVVERQPVLQGIRNAIAELTTRLNQKQSQLQQLEKEQQKQARVKRVEVAQQKLREQVEKIDDIASLLESAYLDLKAIYKEANPDFKALSSAEPGSYAYTMHQLIHFQVVQVPTLVEKNGSFTLGSRTVNLFEPEQKAAREEQAARSRAYRENREKQMAEIQQKQIAEEARQRREQLEAMLSAKQAELEGIKARRAELKTWGGSMNLSGFDHAIAQLEHEIASLEESAK